MVMEHTNVKTSPLKMSKGLRLNFGFETSSVGAGQQQLSCSTFTIFDLGEGKEKWRNKDGKGENKGTSRVLAFDCEVIICFFLHTFPHCFAHQFPGLVQMCCESVIEADGGLLEDHIVHCQVDLDVLQRTHHFANHLQDFALIHS